MSDVTQQILEIRFKPNSRILDLRGLWANKMSDYMGLSTWNIVSNRVDISDKDEKERGFISFRNAGYLVHDANSRSYFAERSTKFLSCLFSYPEFGEKVLIERIGVRSKYCRPFKGTFQDLQERYLDNFLGVNPKVSQLLAAKLVDIGGALNFSDGAGYFHTMSGPMLAEQMKDYFERKEFPEVGLFLDIDYWSTPKKEMNCTEVVKKVQEFCEISIKRFDQVSGIIFS